MEQYLLQEIIKVIENCEEIQISTVSRYTKEEEKKHAYDDIKEILHGHYHEPQDE